MRSWTTFSCWPRRNRWCMVAIGIFAEAGRREKPGRFPDPIAATVITWAREDIDETSWQLDLLNTRHPLVGRRHSRVGRGWEVHGRRFQHADRQRLARRDGLLHQEI